MIELWRKTDGVAACVGELPDKNAGYEKALMGLDEVKITVVVSGPLDVRVKDYILYEGIAYTLNREPDFVKASELEYRYDMVFESPAYNLMDKLYRESLTGQSRFTLTGRLEDFVDLLLLNINQPEFDLGWEKDRNSRNEANIVRTEFKSLSFDSVSCYEVLAKLADEFAVEYRITGRKIAFEDRLERIRDLKFEQGYGNGLYTLKRQNADTENTVTRAYVFGSRDNLPLNYRDRKYDRLVPADEGGEVIPYFENTAEYTKIVERDVFFDDVKPTFTGKPDAVSGVNNKIIRCNAIDFDLNDKTIAIGDTARINFLTGELMGVSFKFTYNHARREITLIEQEDDMAVEGGDPSLAVLPNPNRKPDTDANFNFTGIYLPAAYVTAAEQRLAEKGRKWMEVYAKLRVKYNLDVDYHYLRELGETLEVGDVVRIVVPGGSEQQLRITSLKKQLATGQLTCEVANFLTESWEKQLEGKIMQVRSSVEISKSEVEYSINVTKEWVGRNFGQLSEKMTDREAIVWDDEAHRIKTVPQVPDSVLWDGLRVPDWLDQQVRTTDPVVFKRVTAEEFLEGTEEQARLLAADGGERGSAYGSLTESGGGAWDMTIGSLENVSGLADSAEDGCVLMKKGDMYYPVKIEDGGGTGGVSMRLKSLIGSAVSGIVGSVVRIGYQFTSEYVADHSDTGPGTATYTVNSVLVATETIGQGDVWFDVSKWVTTGTNRVELTVTDSTGLKHTLNYTVEMVQLLLSSTFDARQVFTGKITYRYTPVGALEKTVHFVVDGVELAPVVTPVSNRLMTYDLPAQLHGSHTFEVYMTAVVNGTQVRSNTLYYDLLCVEQGAVAPVITSPFLRPEAEQYQTVTIPFTVYDPAGLTADVTISVDGKVVSEQTVDRTLQTWTYRLDRMGALEIVIACGETRKRFGLTVTESSIVATPETRGLELYLAAANRSNNDRDRERWAYEDTEASLTGFNFKTNGWIAGNDGCMALRVSGNARVEIPFRIFGTDFRAGGKTVEFEFATADVTDYSATIIECMSGGIGLRITAQEALFASEQTRVETKFKEDERVRVSFVVEERAEQRLLYTYINGILSGLAQYPQEDNFMQRIPVNILIGSNDCTVDVYNIRVYNNKLTQYQILDNYIGDLDDFDRKMEIYNRNQIFNNYGDMVYTSVLERIPCMVITGELPAYKGDKKTVTISYTNRREPARSFTSDGVQIDVQGTSSQYYPRKNYKTKHKNGFRMSQSGEMVSRYALREDSITVDTFCEKADFAESSGTHNTGLAKMVHNMLQRLNFRTPPQADDPRVRTTVDGFPIAVFYRRGEADPMAFLGKYNFNNDKSTQETFGFTGTAECWEVCNNTSDRTLFKVSDYATDDWQNDFEGRYPDGNTDYANLKVLTDWLVATRNDPARFKREAGAHFNTDYLLFYYIVTEVFAMVDQRAKNMMLASWGNEGAGDYKWYPIFYDNDTVCGINNEGAMAFSYEVEYHDTIGTQQVFNGEQSVLWNQVEACYAEEIAALYYRMRSGGILTYEKAIEMFNKEQSEKWCEAIYNMDSQCKYIDPLTGEGNASYLYAAQGSRKEHRTWWLYNRFHYMDSKYTAGDFLSDYATMRLYTPSDYAGVEPDADFRIVPFAHQYVRVKYGSYPVGERSYKDREVWLRAPDIQFNDTETIIYGASGLKSLGDMSGKYAGTIDVSKALKLTELLIGSGVPGYRNTNLTVLSVGNNKMLRKVDIRNCPNLKQPLDLSGCENIGQVYAQGTGLTSVILPKAGVLTELYLPETITNLTIQNQPYLSDATFSIPGVDHLTTIRLENMNNINVFALIDRCFALDEVILSRVRLTGIAGNGTGLTTLYGLTTVAGMDENGNNTPMAVVTGKYYSPVVYEQELEAITGSFPELEISYGISAIKFEDSEVQAVCLQNWDTDTDGYLTVAEAAVPVIVLADTFKGKTIKRFDEFGKYFKNVVTLGRTVFGDCIYLKSIVLPEKLETIDNYCFNNCSGLETIRIPKNLRSFGNGVFRNCTQLQSVVFEGDQFTVADELFSNCANLREITLPDTLTSLGNSFFYGCSNLIHVNIPKLLTAIPLKCFTNCSNLEELEIPEGITEIRDAGFYGCKKLKQIEFPAGVASIETNAFRDCMVLNRFIIHAVIPPVLGTMVYYNTALDLSIYVPDQSVNVYQTTAGWSVYATKIKPVSQCPEV